MAFWSWLLIVTILIGSSLTFFLLSISGFR